MASFLLPAARTVKLAGIRNQASGDRERLFVIPDAGFLAPGIGRSGGTRTPTPGFGGRKAQFHAVMPVRLRSILRAFSRGDLLPCSVVFRPIVKSKGPTRDQERRASTGRPGALSVRPEAARALDLALRCEAARRRCQRRRSCRCGHSAAPSVDVGRRRVPARLSWRPISTASRSRKTSCRACSRAPSRW
jgi:hypothetical protein